MEAASFHVFIFMCEIFACINIIESAFVSLVALCYNFLNVFNRLRRVQNFGKNIYGGVEREILRGGCVY